MDAVEEKLEGGMRLAAEGNFRTEEKDVPLSEGRLDDRDGPRQVRLTDGPSTSEWCLAGKPGHWPHVFGRGSAIQPKHRAVLEEHVDFLAEPVPKRQRIVDRNPQHRAGNEEVRGRQWRQR